ncbi:WD repeat-containing and planar cell polarity effector protein fritz [Chionoecetes opilio]|uniref:WD repeat-containing and planar cell polarity effector protein fritz n=1 Tax=Chionoecetes opilio TaxID=41210 RepID=A0A8J4XVD2_CHIOP|nr:WD repeat-containing and planar cell polarity effector protein fritz [Chionoecetes opilio]
MVTLLGDAHFWTLRDDVVIKDADMGAFRYQDKNTVSKERVYYEDKRQYLEARGLMVTPKNSRPIKLRDSLREFEELLAKERVVWEAWKSPNMYQLIFTSGIITTLTVNAQTGDLTRVAFDKFLVGKLLSEHLADVVITRNHILLSYNECRLTVVHLTRPPPEGQVIERLAALDPKLHTCEVAGPSGRRFERRLSANLSGDMVVVWWQTSDDEVYPWSPLAKDRDRANILVYALRAASLDLVCYCRTEMAPLSVSFSRLQPSVLLTVEQGFGRKGGVTVLSCVYEVERGALHRVGVSSVPLEAPLTAHGHTPAEDRLLLACNNGVLALHGEARGTTHLTKAGLIPAALAWLDTGTLVAAANERGQLQCFDLALSLVRLQLTAEDPAPQRVLDLSEHLSHRPGLARLSWAPGRPPGDPEAGPCLLLLHYTKGPLACIRVDGGADGRGGLSALALASQYVKHRQLDEAVNLLVSLSWEQEGPAAMRCLAAVANHLLRCPLTLTRLAQLEAALATFHVPLQPLSPAVEEEFGPAVRALTRRFFFKVLRSGRLEKAYRLALDLRDYDCFLAVHSVAQRRGEAQLAAAALENARGLESSCGSSASCSSLLYGGSDRNASESCGESCSTCFSGSPSEAEDEMGEESGPVGAETPGDRTTTHPALPFTPLTERLRHVGLGSDVNSPPPPQAPQAPPDPPPSRLTTPHTSSHMPHAITSQGGTITINIRQPNMASLRPGTQHTGAVPSHPRLTPTHTPRTPHTPHTPHARARGPARGSRSVREVFYSSDPNEEFVDSEMVSVFMDKKDLKKNYERAVYHGEESGPVGAETPGDRTTTHPALPFTPLTERLRHVGLGSDVNSPPPPQAPQAPPHPPPSRLTTPHTSSHMPHAITSQGGTITINIRQPNMASLRPGTQHTGAVPSHPRLTPTHTPRTPHTPHTPHARARGPARGSRSVREVFYSSDPNEEFVDSEMVSVFMDKKDLKKNYERAVYHEVSTEEEDGGTVKVVHFGVV